MVGPRSVNVASSPKATKRCARCGETKLVTEFHKHAKRSDGLQVYCKSCRAVIDHERYLRQHGAGARRRFAPNRANANWMRELKSDHPCADCGRTFPPEVMQWEHLPGTRKLGNLSTHFSGQSRAAILDELAKCELVCANCHAMRTFERAGWGGCPPAVIDRTRIDRSHSVEHGAIS